MTSQLLSGTDSGPSASQPTVGDAGAIVTRRSTAREVKAFTDGPAAKK